jgi:hypothetical protein
MTNPPPLYFDILYLINECNSLNTGLATDVRYFPAAYANKKSVSPTVKTSMKCLKGSK